MASMMDRGDSYHVIYLGSCMMAQTSTGLGVLQKPLRELYFKYRQAGGGPAAQERYLHMSSKGMTMTYKESASAHPTEVFYSVPNILFWDAVQFVTVRATKRVMGAFEPLDNDLSRNKDNLFGALDKKYHFLQQMTHPPLFACVLRRVTGVKCLDVHAFVCSSEEEALGLVEALNTIQNTYNADEVQETGVFGYKPFGGQPAPGATEIAQAFSRKNSSSSTSSSSAVSRASSMRHLVSIGEPDTAAGPRQTHSAERKQNKPNLNSSVGRGFQLTQNHFIGQPETPSDSGLESGDVSSTDAQSPDDDHVYQYIGHIDESLPRNRRIKSPDKHAPGAAQFSGDLAKEAAKEVKNKKLSVSKEYHSISKSVELLEDTLSPAPFRGDIFLGSTRGLSSSSKDLSSSPSKSQAKVKPTVKSNKSDKLGQGYSLLSGSGSPLPGQEDRDYNREYGEPDTPPLPPRLQGGTSYQNFPTDGSIPRPSLLAHYRNSSYGRDFDYEYGSAQELRNIERPRVLSREDIRSPSRSESVRSPSRSESRNSVQTLPGYEHIPRMGPQYSSPGRNPDAPPRPVAKVQPHKISGVRVLPVGVPVLPNKQKTPDSPDKSKGTFFDSSEFGSKNSGFGLPARRAKSQIFPDSPTRSDYGVNWQFNKAQENDYEYQPTQTQKPEDNSMNEKLLLNQKKDAEIAAVMQNLRFDYDGKTMSPGVPAGNNFERSLGYFP